MSNDSMLVTEKKPVGWYEESIPLRGCYLSLDDIKAVYRDLQSINFKFGEQVLSGINREEGETDEQLKARRDYLLRDAFCLTVTVNGLRDEQLYGETVETFDSKNLPRPIKSIFFTNVNSFRRHANGNEPANRFEAFIDFSKPGIFDPNPFVSAETPNGSNVTVNAQDITFFNAVQKAVEKKITSNRTWYGAIHKNFAYDIGIWFFALPVGMFFSAYYMDKLIPVGSSLELFRWPLFAYFVGISMILYRALTAYAKWAFPVNILAENNDRALKHRLALGGLTSSLFYMFVRTIYNNFIG